MAYSFYGGKQGANIDIKDHFNTVQEMVAAFNNGGSYTTCNYGEYVIIDCPAKHSGENGIIYKRGFEYTVTCPVDSIISSYGLVQNVDYVIANFGNGNTKYLLKRDNSNSQTALSTYVKNPGGGAIYIGQVTGPQGITPEITITDIQTITDLENAGSIYGGSHKTGTVHTSPASPTNDELTYAYGNVINSVGDITSVVIAFDVPSYMAYFTAKDFLWDHSEHKMPDELINKVDSDSGTFYSSWSIKVPTGIHGQDFVDLAIDETTQQLYYTVRSYEDNYEGVKSNKIYLENAFVNSLYAIEPQYDEGGFLKSFLLTFTTLDENGDRKTQVIKVPTYNSVTVEDTGEMWMTDTEGNRYDLNTIKWVKRVYFDTVDNKIKIVYNTNDDPDTLTEESFIRIEGIRYNAGDLNKDHKLYVTYSKGTKVDDDGNVIVDGEGNPVKDEYEIPMEHPINGIEKFVYDLNNFHLYVLYTAPESRLEDTSSGWVERPDGYWYYDLGYIKGEPGSMQYYGEFGSLSDLQTQFPNGFTQAEYKGWLASVDVGTAKEIYAYDYKNNKWVDLGSLDAAAIEPNKSIVISRTEPTTLNMNGIWLVVSD